MRSVSFTALDKEKVLDTQTKVELLRICGNIVGSNRQHLDEESKKLWDKAALFLSQHLSDKMLQS